MTTRHAKTVAGILWVLLGAVVLSGDRLTFTRAMLFVALGLLPTVVMIALRNPLPQMLSESIDEAPR